MTHRQIRNKLSEFDLNAPVSIKLDKVTIDTLIESSANCELEQFMIPLSKVICEDGFIIIS